VLVKENLEVIEREEDSTGTGESTGKELRAWPLPKNELPAMLARRDAEG
jgi:hypothetical protein